MWLSYSRRGKWSKVSLSWKQTCNVLYWLSARATISVQGGKGSIASLTKFGAKLLISKKTHKGWKKNQLAFSSNNLSLVTPASNVGEIIDGLSHRFPLICSFLFKLLHNSSALHIDWEQNGTLTKAINDSHWLNQMQLISVKDVSVMNS